MFVNTLTADGKYRCQYCENLQLPIQMQLSEKRKTFPNFLFHVWNLHQILNLLMKKMMVIANVFPKLQTVKSFFTPLYQKCHFGTRLDSRRLKLSRNLAKSPWECFYDVFSSIWGKSIWKISPLVLGEI